MRFFLALLCFLPLTTWALTPVKLALDWYINPDHAPLLIAQQQGFFRQHGLSVHFISPTQSSEGVQLLAANKVNLAIDYEPTYHLQRNAGMPLLRIGTLINQPLNCLTTLASSHITSLTQLKGKSIGYSGGQVSENMLKTMLHSVGLSLHDVTLINVQMNLNQALLSHRVAAVMDMMRNVEPVQLRLSGIHTTLFLPEHYGVKPYAELIVVANRKHLHPKTIKAFNQAMQQGACYVKQHPLKSWQIARQAYPSQLAPTPESAKANRAIWLATVGYFSCAKTQASKQYDKHDSAE